MFETEKSLVKAVLVATGRELLTGRVQDTNSNWLAKRLFDQGVKVFRIVAVDDDHDEIGLQIERAAGDGADMLVTTGGLGPTPDDMTIRCVADAAGIRLERSPEALEMITARYLALVAAGRLADAGINPDRAKMADLPAGARIIPNDVGTAPGVDFMAGGMRIFCLPGPPREMIPMAERYVLPAVAGMIHGVLLRLTIDTDMMDESLVAARIREVQPSFPSVHFKPEPGILDGRRVMRIHLESAGEDSIAVEALLACAAAAFRKREL